MSISLFQLTGSQFDTGTGAALIIPTTGKWVLLRMECTSGVVGMGGSWTLQPQDPSQRYGFAWVGVAALFLCQEEERLSACVQLHKGSSSVKALVSSSTVTVSVPVGPRATLDWAWKRILHGSGSTTRSINAVLLLVLVGYQTFLGTSQ